MKGRDPGFSWLTMKMHRVDGPGARQAGVLFAALVAMVLTFCVVIPAHAQAREVIGHWTLDEGSGQSAADVSGHGHDGRLGAFPDADPFDPTWVPGRFGSALRFLSDANQSVDIARPETLTPARITVEAWIRRLGTPGQWRYIVSNGGQACYFSSFGLYTGSGGGVAFYVSNGSGYVGSPAVAPAAVWDGAWHYAVGSYDGQHVRFYLDGAEVGAGSPNQLNISYGLAARNAYLGSYRGSCDLPFTGDVDEVKVHDGVLSAQEVADSAAAAGLQSIPPQTAPVDGPPAAGGCFGVRAVPGKLFADRRTRLRITVRRRGRAAPRMRLILRGVGVRTSVRTGRKGHARLRVRPKRKGRLKVRVAGQSGRCPAARLKVRRAPN